LGRISGVYGVKGWCRVFSYTQPREGILHYSPWTLKAGDKLLACPLTDGRKQGKGIVVKLEGCDDRDAALALMDYEISVPREQLPETQEDEYYWADLVGLQVLNEQEEDLGKVASVFATGANDVLVVQGEQERLIPFVQPDVINSIDLKTGIIRVDWDSDF